MCEFYKFLYWVIPVKSLQSYLIKKHFSGCSFCQKEAAEDSQLKKILALTDAIKEEESLWPQIRSSLYAFSKEESELKEEPGFTPFKKRKWVLTASFLLVVIIVSLAGISYFLFLKSGFEMDSGKLAKSVLVESATVQGKPAKIYLFQPKNRKLSIIWMDPTID